MGFNSEAQRGTESFFSKKLRVALLAFVAVLVAIAGMAAYVSWEFAHTSVATSLKGTESVSDFVILVSPGDSLVHVAETLQQNRIITSSKLFLWFARFKGQYGSLKHGEYLVKGDMTPGKILEIITSGRSIEKSLTIAEGLNLFEIAQVVSSTGIISREEFWSLTHDLEFIKSVLGEYGDGVRSLEGFLFPETYKYNRFTSGKALLMNMVRQSLSVLKVYEADMKKAGLSPLQTLTMASIVEKETGKSEERPMIASVFFNRLKKNMRFQTDPTVLYAKMLVSNKLENNISKADLSNDHPYNTYTRMGLPPGPISSAGKMSIEAVLHPATTNYLYFVSKNDGSHEFSENYEKHAMLVKKYQASLLNSKVKEAIQ